MAISNVGFHNVYPLTMPRGVLSTQYNVVTLGNTEVIEASTTLTYYPSYRSDGLIVESSPKGHAINVYV